ncbi:predicted protein [Candida tropicalis MYA-3404]|uniref:Topoisomerase I damage affected protein 2 n=1 Tax=Candida tropicalis (strain ATCC MYA-3404 / T1) TaxID=294747 RepID=C5M652_CANTT|nr:predicted protein [Candida tropicalis MYA-3404]EER34472.1 predicted protein [Candida tropicalis MYA-3404]KAG4408345.1 hypothetical protein JTP64_001651 [Candida tropicalis]MCP8719629.1 dynein light chain Tctex-type family protein [Asgard group archaeon]
MPVQVLNKSQNLEAPFTQDFISDLVEQHANLTSKNLITKVAESLKEKSSKHKFIVQATALHSDDTSFDLKIQSDFVALWDPKKDGCFTLKVSQEGGVEASTLITIYWISI